VSERDHFVEQPAPWVAAVCDRGLRHTRNEDAVALHAQPEPTSHAVLVVCDGVSSSTDSDVASLAAARVARDVLAVSNPKALGTAATRLTATARALEAAADAANSAVIAHTSAGPGNPASCTFVAAVIEQSLLVVGWVGDSRAYWLPDSGDGRLLTVDDSFAAEQIAEGVPRADAETGPQAHAITRWLGIDAPDHTPRTASLDLTDPGWVMVCSDGLWNYSSEPDDMTALIRDTVTATGQAPLDLAAALVEWANAQGGQDNITVALARVGEPTPSTTAAYREEVTPDGNVHS
jgi:serine/threonine protein phosphatase PrpC